MYTSSIYCVLYIILLIFYSQYLVTLPPASLARLNVIAMYVAHSPAYVSMASGTECSSTTITYECDIRHTLTRSRSHSCPGDSIINLRVHVCCKRFGANNVRDTVEALHRCCSMPLGYKVSLLYSCSSQMGRPTPPRPGSNVSRLPSPTHNILEPSWASPER